MNRQILIVDIGGIVVERLSALPGGYDIAGKTALEVEPEHDGFPGDRINADGSITKAPPEPEPVPSPVSARQLKLALLADGLLDAVDAHAAAAPRAEQISWEYSTEFHRNHPMLLAAAADFGMTDEQLDGLFRYAAAL